MSYDQIKIEAEKVLNKYALQQLPIDIFNLIERMELKIMFEDMEDDHSGFLLVEKGKATVAINEDHHINRQRFTAAHELGHFVLHAKEEDELFVDKTFQRGAVSSTGTDYREIEANRFAAEILMPEKVINEKIEEEIGDSGLTDLDIYQLAMEFQVSEQAMTLRLVNLGLIDN